MFTLIRRIPVSRLALFTIFGKNADTVQTPGYEGLNKKDNGIVALRKMFGTNEYGEWSPEFVTVMHMSLAGTFVGILGGAFLEGREAFSKFIENNEATQFANHLDAKRQLQDRMTWAMGKGALKWGPRIGGFIAIFTLSSTCIRVYRGEPGFLEHLGAGIITGGLLRFKLGPKGVVAGSVVGGFLGAIAGALQIAVLYLTGYTMDDIEKQQYEFHAKRNEGIREAMKNHLRTEQERIEFVKAKLNIKDPNSSPLDNVTETTAK